jgi:hypothetical protein
MKLNYRERIQANVARKTGGGEFLNPIGTFVAEHYRNGKLLDVYKGKNAITTAGKNNILDVQFGAASPLTQTATWYIGLINNTPTPTLLVADTLASHTGWTEFTSYTGNRKAWDDADAASGTKGTTSVSTFTLSAAATIYGIFICSASTGTSGILWSEGAFASPITLAISDDLKVSYSIGF